MSSRFRMPSGVRSTVRSALAALVLGTAGCLYSFTGGGLPPHVRTIAVLEFENRTPQGVLASDLHQAMLRRIPRDLGVRVAAERDADAVIRGRIISYDERPEAVRPGEGVSVAQQRVDIGIEVEIYDQREDRLIWRSPGVVSETGYYAPGQQQVGVAQEEAIRKLVVRIVDGAQSQW
jgi:hypothetical protein